MILNSCQGRKTHPDEIKLNQSLPSTLGNQAQTRQLLVKLLRPCWGGIYDDLFVFNLIIGGLD